MAQEQTVGSGIADWLELAHGILTLALGAAGFSLSLTLLTIGWSDLRFGLAVGFALGGIVSCLPGLAQICRRPGG